MKEIMTEKLNSLATNPEFATELRNSKSIEDAHKVFTKNGIEITTQELENGYEQAISAMEEEGYIHGNELTEKGLELVAGGLNTTVTTIGIAVGVVGLGVMMAGPVTVAAAATWAGGCLLGACGLGLPGKKKVK